MRRPTDNSEPTVGWSGEREGQDNKKENASGDGRERLSRECRVDGWAPTRWFEMNQKYESLIEVGKGSSIYDVHGAVGGGGQVGVAHKADIRKGGCVIVIDEHLGQVRRYSRCYHFDSPSWSVDESAYHNS